MCLSNEFPVKVSQDAFISLGLYEEGHSHSPSGEKHTNPLFCTKHKLGEDFSAKH